MFFIIILLNFVLNVEILLDIANHAFTYQCKAAQAAQTACYCSKTLAFPQNWTTSAPQKQIDQDCPDPFPASLQRPCLGTEDHGRNGQLSVALHPVWQVEWQEARQLPNLSTALDQRYKARQHAQITKEPCKSDHPQLSSQQLGMVWRWQPEEQVKEQRRPKRECQKKEGKRQGRPRETGNCTALTLRPTCSDSTLAYARKCSNLKPADSDCTRSSSCEFGVPGSHTQGLPRYQPGPRGHPEDRGEVRQDCNQSALNRSEQSLQTGGTSCTSSLHNQRSANSPPSELAEAPQRFCGQLAKAAPALKDQQQTYGDQLTKAQHELNQARRHLQQLNKQAAAVGTPTAETGDLNPEHFEADTTATFEAEAQALVAQVQESLQQSIAAASAPIIDFMEINTDEEDGDRLKKRPRSMEPFGGPHAAEPSLPSPTS